MEYKIKVFIPSLNKWFEEDNTVIRMTNGSDCSLIITQEPSPYNGEKDRLKIIKNTEKEKSVINIEPSSSNSFYIK